MATIEVAVLNEDRRPLKGVTVEAIHGTTLVITATAVTGDNGIAIFTLDTEHFFRPLVRRTSVTVGDQTFTGEVEVQIVSSGGLGPYRFDYLIDESWAVKVAAGKGTEGQVFSTFHGHTFRVYSTPFGATEHARLNRNATNQSTSFGFVSQNTSPDYAFELTDTLLLDPPNGGSWALYGVGTGPTRIIAADSLSGAMVQMATLTNIGTTATSSIELHDLEFVIPSAANDVTTHILMGQNRRGVIENCNFIGAGIANFQAISTALGVVAIHIEKCRFVDNVAVSIGGSVDADVHITDCIFESGTLRHISFSAGSGRIHISGNWFIGAGEAAIAFIAGTAAGTVNISSNYFTGCARAVKFRGSGTPFLTIWASFGIVGNTIYQTKVTPQIDFTELEDFGQQNIVTGVTIDGNNFNNVSAGSSAVAIAGDDDPTPTSGGNLIIGNTFVDYADSDHCYRDWDQNGNEAMHNIAVDFGAVPPTKIALPDIGSPVGHVNVASDLPEHDHSGDGEGGTVSITIETYIPFGSVQVAIGP